MKADDLETVMLLVELTWKNQAMEKLELDEWRKELARHDADLICDTIAEYGGMWRPGIKELLEFHGSRVRRARMAAVPATDVDWRPPTPEEKRQTLKGIQAARDKLRGVS